MWNVDPADLMQRDKSLTPELVDTLMTLPRLRSLEISGHSYRYYDPTLIGRFPALEDLRIMMPDSLWGENLVKVVRELDKRESGGLRGLGLICRVRNGFHFAFRSLLIV